MGPKCPKKMRQLAEVDEYSVRQAFFPFKPAVKTLQQCATGILTHGASTGMNIISPSRSRARQSGPHRRVPGPHSRQRAYSATSGQPQDVVCAWHTESRGLRPRRQAIGPASSSSTRIRRYGSRRRLLRGLRPGGRGRGPTSWAWDRGASETRCCVPSWARQCLVFFIETHRGSVDIIVAATTTSWRFLLSSGVEPSLRRENTLVCVL